VESIHNENFKRVEFDSFKNGCNYTRSDIALEFASWLSPEFKLYVIQEFQRLEKNLKQKSKQQKVIKKEEDDYEL
jgi:hypothetical protein